MSGYNYNLYDGGGIPDQGSNGLPLVIADANLPTQAVSASPVEYSTPLHYSPHMVESGLRTPATTQRIRDVQYARVAASGAPSKQKFEPAPQPAKPPLWRSVINAVVGGKIKTGSTYAAQNNYTAQGSGGAGLSGIGASSGSSGTSSAGTTATVGTVTAGGARTA